MIKVYTDGSCKRNPGPGGWAAVFTFNDNLKIIKGNDSNTTNNKMELIAVINACKKILKISKKDKFEIVSDSAYVINTIKENWINEWIKNGWKTSKGKEIKNKDLWKELEEVLNCIKEKEIKIRFVKVKGHSGNMFNELVDSLAKEEANNVKETVNND